MNQKIFSALFALLLSCSIAGCSGEKKADAATPAKRKAGSVAPRPTVVSAPASPYKIASVPGAGKITGTIDFDGAIPVDSVMTPTQEQMECGQKIVDRRVQHMGSRIAGAVVWLTDIRTGKSFPLQRRFELVNEDCLLSPKVQIVFSPSTLNVVSEDVALHRDRIINVGTGEVEAEVPFNDNGEVVPYDKLFEGTKQLEITCELHPWAKAWILVVDHPYVATTENNGTFSIDAVPPGTYHIKAWHPLLGVAEQTVTVAAGGSANVALKLGAAAGPAPDTSSARTRT
jgi:hypothetical protein